VEELRRGLWRWTERHPDSNALARHGAVTEPPESVESIPVPLAEETLFWIAEHCALVPGDLVIAAAGGGLRLCPDPWLGYVECVTGADVRAKLRPVLELPVELVLASHGQPVLEDGRGALARALD
jgi:hypothetical protein